MNEVRRASFVVRVVQDERGDVSGIVEQVASGAKEAFSGMEAIGLAIAKMLHGASALPPAGSDTSPATSEPPAPGAVQPGSVRNAAARQARGGRR